MELEKGLKNDITGLQEDAALHDVFQIWTMQQSKHLESSGRPLSISRLSQLASLVPMKKVAVLRWSSTIQPVQIHPFTSSVGPTSTLPPTSQELLEMFFTDDILEGISTGNNCYTQSNILLQVLSRAVKKGFLFHEGPFVKELDNALQGFGVHHQQYFGGACIGDHVHAVLKVSNIDKLCTSILGAAQEKLPHKSDIVENETIKFVTLFAKCQEIT
ncbi:hypothetical protein EMCRGX_G000967 [Ephydatia muelleri]